MPKPEISNLELEITHFMPHPPEEDAWTPVTFYTRQKGNEKEYYCGLETDLPYSAEEIDWWEKYAQLQRLPNPVDYNEKNYVWITPDCEIYSADRKDPVRDPNKKLLFKREMVK